MTCYAKPFGTVNQLHQLLKDFVNFKKEKKTQNLLEDIHRSPSRNFTMHLVYLLGCLPQDMFKNSMPCVFFHSHCEV